MKRSVKIILSISICLLLLGCDKNISVDKEDQEIINYGEINSEILRKSFKEINELHINNFPSYKQEINKITYEENTILIESIINIENNQIYINETYNTNTNKLNKLNIYMPNDNIDIVKEFITKVSLIKSINPNNKNTKDIEKLLLDGTINVDNCQNINDFCISSTRTDLLNTYNFIRK